MCGSLLFFLVRVGYGVWGVWEEVWISFVYLEGWLCSIINIVFGIVKRSVVIIVLIVLLRFWVLVWVFVLFL